MSEEKQQPQVGISPDQLASILDAINNRSDERMIKFAQELRKPTPEEQAKLDRDLAKTKERALAAARVAMADEEGKKNAAKMCPHGTTHEGTGVFKHQWRAQVHTPAGERAYYIPRCTQCGSTWDTVYGLPSPKVVATQDQMKEGVNLDKWSVNDIHRVVEWLKLNPVAEEVTA
jgi:hypothetical protein